MNELFLVSITLLTFLIKGNDKAPALVYGFILHIVYFVSISSKSVALAHMFAGVCDALVIILLVCLSGCLRSRLTFFLIPLSIVSAIIQFWGWRLEMTGGDIQSLVTLSAIHMCVMVALFAFAAGGYGNLRWDHRLLDRDIRDPKSMGMVSK